MVRTEPGKTKEALTNLGKLCKELNPQFPFAYKFLDEEYQKLYKSEQIVSTFYGFCLLGIFIRALDYWASPCLPLSNVPVKSEFEKYWARAWVRCLIYCRKS